MSGRPCMARERLHAAWHAARQPTTAICARALAASTQPRRVHREAVGSSLERRARGCAAEASTLATVLHRCQAGRAWPASASTPHGTQLDSPRWPPSSCSRSIHPPLTHVSRSREQQLGEACLWTCVRSHHACSGAPPMSGRPGMAHERLQAAWRAARQPMLTSVLVLSQHPPSPNTCIEKP